MGFFPPCKKELGVIISRLQKNMGEIMSTYTKMGRDGGVGGVGGGGGGVGGGCVPEGFCPAPNTDITRLFPAFQILSQYS